MTYKNNSELVLLDPASSYGAPTHTTPTLSGQACSVYIPTSDPGYPPVIWGHPANGNQTVGDSGITKVITDYLTGRGFVVAASNLHGDNWGNDAAITDMENLLTHLAANSNADTSRVLLIGVSMGWITACSYARNGAATVLAMVSIVGACDLSYVHDNGFGTSIDTAYTDHAGYLAAFDTRDPQTIATGGYLDDIPIAMWWDQDGTIDNAVGVTETATFLATAPLAEDFGNVFGHLGFGWMHAPTAGSFLMNQTAVAQARSLLT